MVSKRGKYIVLESGEGFGKTTHLKGITEFLKEKKVPHIVTREPGGTKIGISIRDVLLNPDLKEPLPLTKLLLYSGDRVEHSHYIIIPNLEKGVNVVGDRSHISTRVYQHAEGVNSEDINQIEKIINVVPIDLAIIIDGDSRQGLKNAGLNVEEFGKPDTFERKTLDFHERLREGYLKEIAQNPDRYIKVPYIHENPRAMQQEIRRHIKERLKI